MEILKIKAKELSDGDIFYCDLMPMNKDLLGGDVDLAGSDVVLIADEVTFDGCFAIILVNGGHMVYIEKEEYVYLLGHYSKLLKRIEIIKKQ